MSTAAPPAGDLPAATIAAVRRFNRFYTQRLGLLDEHLQDSPWSLTEARLLFELAHREAPSAAELARDLDLDPGYLSRLIVRLESAGLVERRRSPSDARRNHVLLTVSGRESFATLDRGSHDAIVRLLGPLTRDGRERVVEAMACIHDVLAAPSQPATLRALRPGDAGWVVERHGALYVEEFGYDASFEALVARIAADFLQRHDPARERGWIAERAGQRVGAVLCVREDVETAKLRLLIVEPSARGLGIGGQLVDACSEFARAAGYARIRLWTQSHLAAARRIYEAAGYLRIAEEAHRSFGLDLVAETWELDLRRSR